MRVDGVGDAEEHRVPMTVVCASRNRPGAHGQFCAERALAEGDYFSRPIRIVESVVSEYLQENIDVWHIAKLSIIGVGNIHERRGGCVTYKAVAGGQSVILVTSARE